MIQTKINDQWAYYQAKNIRSHIYNANSETAKLIKRDASVAEDFRKKSEDRNKVLRWFEPRPKIWKEK